MGWFVCLNIDQCTSCAAYQFVRPFTVAHVIRFLRPVLHLLLRAATLSETLLPFVTLYHYVYGDTNLGSSVSIVTAYG